MAICGDPLAGGGLHHCRRTGSLFFMAHLDSERAVSKGIGPGGFPVVDHAHVAPDLAQARAGSSGRLG